MNIGLIRTEETIGPMKMLLAYMSGPSSAHSPSFQVKCYVRLGRLKISSFRSPKIRVIQSLL